MKAIGTHTGTTSVAMRWVIALVAVAAVLCVSVVSGCGSETQGFEGSYSAAPSSWVDGPLVVEITKFGESYIVNAPPRVFDTEATVEDGKLVVHIGRGGQEVERVVFEHWAGDRLRAKWFTPPFQTPTGISNFGPYGEVIEGEGDLPTHEDFEHEMLRSSNRAVKRQIDLLATRVEAWSLSHNNRVASAEQLRPRGAFWKWEPALELTNAFTGQPMVLGDGPGSFHYAVSPDGRHFTLAGLLSDERVYRVER